MSAPTNTRYFFPPVDDGTQSSPKPCPIFTKGERKDGEPLPRFLFIDRDGTIICEPADEQIDAVDKLVFLPDVFDGLRKVAKSNYIPILVSNQDGLGTESFPWQTFTPLHELIIRTVRSEGLTFAAELIDRTFPQEQAPTRKPGTAMFREVLPTDWDKAHSFVIGDRATDVQLAVNLGCRAVLLQPSEVAETMLDDAQKAALALATPHWSDIAEYLRRTERRGEIARKTAETDIHVLVDLDGEGETRIDTGLHFFDHMLAQLPHHAGIALVCTCRGDLEVDEHHTMEDVAIALGEALRHALGTKKGIERYGFTLPMDECDAQVSIDLGGRIDFAWDVPLTREYVGDTPTEMFKHFFQSLASALQCNLHIRARGENNHHLIEGVYKAFARALRQAIRRDVFSNDVPSSKGII